MTEQNYVDPEQNQSATAETPVAEQMSALVLRIGQLEQQVAELQQQLALAQGGVVQTYSP